MALLPPPKGSGFWCLLNFMKEDNSLVNTISEKSEHCDYDIVPEDVTAIEADNAFLYCNSSGNIKISKSVTAIDGHSFCFCRNIRNIIVDNDNMSFSDINGVLFNKQQTMLKINKNLSPTILNKVSILSY